MSETEFIGHGIQRWREEQTRRQRALRDWLLLLTEACAYGPQWVDDWPARERLPVGSVWGDEA